MAFNLNTSNVLFQIKHIIKGESGDQGMMMEITPWQNHPPVISALIAQSSTLEVGQRTNITCHAADQDRYFLHYTWLSTGGMIAGEPVHRLDSS